MNHPENKNAMKAADSSAQEPIKSSKLTLRKKLLFTAVMVASCLALLELSLRMFWTRPVRTISADGEVMQQDATLGWRPRPNLDFSTHYAGAANDITVRTNSHGFRDREHALAAEPGVTRIVVLGDSFVFGSGVSNGEIFTDRLRELVPNSEVINLGVTGYRTLQYKKMLEAEGLQYRPQLVILGFCQNDVMEQCIPTGNPDAAAPPGSNWRDRLNQYCYLADFVGGRVSHFKPLSKWLANIGVKRPLGGFESLSDNLRTSLIEYPPQLTDMWQATLREVEGIKQLCNASSVQFLVAAIPARESVDGEALTATLAAVNFEPEHFNLAKPYSALDEFCRSRKIAYIEGYTAARDAKVPLYLPNDVHFNPAGHQLFAEVLARKVKELTASEHNSAAGNDAARK